MSLKRYRLKHKCLGKKPRYFRFRKTPFSVEKRAVFLTIHDVFSFDGNTITPECMQMTPEARRLYVYYPPDKSINSHDMCDKNS